MKLSNAEAIAVFGEIAADASPRVETLAAFITYEVVPSKAGPKNRYNVVAVLNGRDRREQLER